MSRNLLITAASTVAAAAVLSACGSTVTVNPSATGATTTTTSSTTTSETPSETTTSETTSETPSETTTSETTTTTSAPSPATSVDEIHKSAFLKVVKQRFPNITDAAALADGQFVCGEMGQDKNILTVIGDLKEKHPDWSTTNAGYFLGVSIGALCPQYTSKVTAGA